ncbi:MAG: 3-phosphoserine/phosphohydroxythreonine transaminase [Flavobacteriaceae bacterium]
MKKHNFSAGPCILPQEVMEKAAQAVVELDNSGLSLIEISHRSPAFIDIMDRATSLVLELLDLKDKGYTAMFLQGGASTQFIATAYNLLENKAGYCNTGTWSTKALKEAKLLGEAVEISSSKDANFNYIPKGFDIPSDLDYLHITTNNTIFGTQYKALPETNTTLVADSSSDIFSRELDFSKFGLLYAGAQKNMGPAGTTLVVVREDILGKVSHQIPSMLDYKIHADKGSMFNTPPVFAVYTSMLNLEWLKNKGGIAAIEKENEAKAAFMYSEIDRNPLFDGFAAKEDRSTMNATFTLNTPELKDTFEAMAKEAGLNGINGHRSVGGYRASMYNALPIASVQALVDVMKTLEQNA